MAKCPLYGKCTIDASLLASVGAEDNASEWYKYDHVMCQGKGTPANQWETCVKYDPHEASSISSWRSNGCLVWLARIPIIAVPLVLISYLVNNGVIMFFIAILVVWIACMIIPKD